MRTIAHNPLLFLSAVLLLTLTVLGGTVAAQGDDDTPSPSPTPTAADADDDTTNAEIDDATDTVTDDPDTLTLTASDTLTELTLSFDYPLEWEAAFVSGGGGFLFANSADAFAVAESSLLGTENEALPSGGQAFVTLPLPEDFFEDADSLDAQFEEVRGIFGGDGFLGDTEDLLVAGFAARRAPINDETPNEGYVYLIQTDTVGLLLLAAIYEASADEDITASVEAIAGSVRLGDLSESINPAAALPRTLDTTDGTLTLSYPDGWFADPDLAVLASSEEALQAARDGEAIPADALAISVTTPADLQEFFGIDPDTSARAALSALYGLLELDDPVLDFPVLQAPAVIATAPEGLLAGQGVYIAMDSPTGTILFGVQYSGNFTAIESTIIPILNSAEYTPAD